MPNQLSKHIGQGLSCSLDHLPDLSGSNAAHGRSLDEIVLCYVPPPAVNRGAVLAIEARAAGEVVGRSQM